jgi:exopolyphosphatase/guanosine-5'-triphosphate,3'-diphosphate pyrophosphatase
MPTAPTRGSRPAAAFPVAVIDIGSNSGRVVVYDADAAGQLRILASTRAALRLVDDVDDDRRLSAASVRRTLEALADFRAIAVGAGARRILAVATAAMRDAANGAAFVRRVRSELGIRIATIDGAQEARYGFLGALRGLPVDHGMLFDIGGGSMQVSLFRGRRLGREWSLPLGALRLSHRFLLSDPPRRQERRRLVEHVRRKLERAGIPALPAGATLVGTGGTLRNLAKIDRSAREYPVLRLHGYVIARKRIGEIAARLGDTRAGERERVPGLSDERADSIVGGAIAVHTLMDFVGAGRVLVSGQGLREGLAYSLLGDALPAPQHLREASVASLSSRFSTFRASAAQRRRDLAAALRAELLPRAGPEVAEALGHAAFLLDVGRSLDFFDRHEHVADMVRATELFGFTHRQIALIAAIVLAARTDRLRLGDFAPLLGEDDRAAVLRAGLLLALADDIEERCPPGRRLSLRCRSTRAAFVAAVPQLAGWRPRGLGQRFARLFGRALLVRRG